MSKEAPPEAPPKPKPEESAGSSPTSTNSPASPGASPGNSAPPPKEPPPSPPPAAAEVLAGKETEETWIAKHRAKEKELREREDRVSRAEAEQQRRADAAKPAAKQKAAWLAGNSLFD